MADHTDHKLTHDTLRRTELVSVDADFLHCARGASASLRDLLNSRGEESFTPVLHGALHRSLHLSAAGKARQVNPIEVPKTVSLREGRNREVRRVMAHLGLSVSRLIRVAYGPFQLGFLERGGIEEIPARVLREQLPADAGAPPPLPRRR